MMTPLAESERLLLRKFDLDDAEFIFQLLNTPGWLEFIGDRNIKSLDDAKNYIANGPLYMYNKLGYGPYLAALKDTGQPVGMCSLIKRETLDDIDIGFAFLPEYAGQGYAYEASQATIDYAKTKLGINSIIAITNTNNVASIQLLKKLGMRFDKKIKLPGETEELLLFKN